MTMTYIGHCPNSGQMRTGRDRETEWNRLVKDLETKKNKCHFAHINWNIG